MPLNMLKVLDPAIGPHPKALSGPLGVCSGISHPLQDQEHMRAVQVESADL